jgi:putative NADPH-quinone reductase
VRWKRDAARREWHEAGKEEDVKTLVLKASPNKEGNTATLADRVVAGLRVGGEKDIVEFSLHDLALRPCQACNACLRPPYSGCVLDDGYQQVYPVFRDADLVVLAAPVYWWHLCAQAKTFVDRWHSVLTFDRDHCLARKRLALVLAYFAEDPYGVDLVQRMFESITGWCGARLDVVRYHSAERHVKEVPEKLAEAYELGRSLAGWTAPDLTTRCPLPTCRMPAADDQALARHLVMAADDQHLAWKHDHLSATHSLANTSTLVREALDVLRRT